MGRTPSGPSVRQNNNDGHWVGWPSVVLVSPAARLQIEQAMTRSRRPNRCDTLFSRRDLDRRVQYCREQ